WDLARRHPEVVDRLGVANVPHLSAFRKTLRSNPAQMARSWYAAFFQLPRLPEWASRRNDFALWVRALRDGANPGTFTDEDVARYRDAWRQEGAPTAMLNWYRALVRYRDDPPNERVTTPTLVVWGENDRALVPELARKSLDYCADGRLERFPGATHWVHHEFPERVTALLIEHLAE
ncbi:MAG: alpha/beta hydrolase, partial [Halobacteriales archaeon]|nr:alpha/beta hydrolase [Halobacteriales archaeon]